MYSKEGKAYEIHHNGDQFVLCLRKDKVQKRFKTTDELLVVLKRFFDVNDYKCKVINSELRLDDTSPHHLDYILELADLLFDDDFLI